MKAPKKPLSASEALFGFCGWLTTRKQKIVMSGKHNAAPVAEAAAQYCKTNGLRKPRKGWENNLKTPVDGAKANSTGLG